MESATSKRQVPGLKRTRPPAGFTNSDLALGTVLGFIAGLLVAVFAMFLLRAMAGPREWTAEVGSAARVVVGAATGGAIMRGLLGLRRRTFIELRTLALQQQRCPECDYDLRGTIDPRCPECGEAFTAEEWKLTAQGADAGP